jgi:hypothetical protein
MASFPPDQMGGIGRYTLHLRGNVCRGRTVNGKQRRVRAMGEEFLHLRNDMRSAFRIGTVIENRITEKDDMAHSSHLFTRS